MPVRVCGVCVNLIYFLFFFKCVLYYVVCKCVLYYVVCLCVRARMCFFHLVSFHDLFFLYVNMYVSPERVFYVLLC